MSEVELVTVEVINPLAGIVSVEILGDETPVVELETSPNQVCVEVVTGNIGAVGPQGPTGPQGPQGPAGQDGLQGPEGPQGPAGQDGEDGQDGQDGQDGADGRDGVDGQDGKDGEDGAGADLDQVTDIAKGAVLGLQQELVANAGHPAKTVLAVGATNTGRVQGVSLGSGNVVRVYASGADFNAGNVLYQEFMELGEPICFEDITNIKTGTIITASEGFYGASEQINLPDEVGPMPLLSYGLSFEFSFLYGFRKFDFGDGKIHVVNGPLDNLITLTDGFGVVQLSQENITLAPWGSATLDGDGDKEYILRGTAPMMACVQSFMSEPQIRDNRLVMPLTNDGMCWARSGFASAPYDNTQVDYFVRDGINGSLNAPNGISPGSPVDIQAETGAGEADYLPDGLVRFRAKGLMSAFSGADGQGKEAAPMQPVSTMSQVVPQMFHIDDAGDGSRSSIAIASPYECEAKIYEWDDASSSPVLAYDLQLTRTNVTVTSRQDQFHPAVAVVSNDTGSGAVELTASLRPGVVIATAPVMVIVQNGDINLQPTIRSQNGGTTTSIINEADETLMLGWTPDDVRAEITSDANGLLRRRTIDSNGIESWVLV